MFRDTFITREYDNDPRKFLRYDPDTTAVTPAGDCYSVQSSSLGWDINADDHVETGWVGPVLGSLLAVWAVKNILGSIFQVSQREVIIVQRRDAIFASHAKTTTATTSIDLPLCLY